MKARYRRHGFPHVHLGITADLPCRCFDGSLDMYRVEQRMHGLRMTNACSRHAVVPARRFKRAVASICYNSNRDIMFPQ